MGPGGSRSVFAVWNAHGHDWASGLLDQGSGFAVGGLGFALRESGFEDLRGFWCFWCLGTFLRGAGVLGGISPSLASSFLSYFLFLHSPLLCGFLTSLLFCCYPPLLGVGRLEGAWVWIFLANGVSCVEPSISSWGSEMQGCLP